MRFFLVVIFLVIILGAMLVAASLYFYNVAIKRSKKEFLRDDPDLQPPKREQEVDAGQKRTELSGRDWLELQPLETWQMESDDGLRLIAHYLPASTPTLKTVVLAHGYTSQGKDMGSFARFYRDDLGYNVLMPDARGHGQSGGDYIGFGWPERKDYLLWIQELLTKLGDDVQIVLHGISMGGATVMMVSGEPLPNQVKAIIEDCGYTSAWDELAYQLKRMYKLPVFPILPATSFVTRKKAGYSLSEASALKQLERNTRPMFFIHGEEDRFVPIEMVWELYQACRSEKEIYIVKGAGHGTAFGTDRVAYVQKVSAFLDRFID